MRQPFAAPVAAAPARSRLGAGIEGGGGAPTCEPRRFGSAGEAMRALRDVLARAPRLVRVYAGGLDPALRERVMVAVSEANGCGECARVHRRWAVHEGVERAEVAALAGGGIDMLDARNRAAVAHAAALLESGFASGAGSADAGSVQLSGPERDGIEAISRAMTFANLTVGTVRALRAGRPRVRLRVRAR